MQLRNVLIFWLFTKLQSLNRLIHLLLIETQLIRFVFTIGITLTFGFF